MESPRLGYALGIAKELGKVVLLLCLSIFVVQIILLVADNARAVTATVTATHETVAAARDAAISASMASDKVNALLGPLESRSASPQTVAHAIASANQVIENAATGLQLASTVIPAALHTVQSADAAIHQVDTVLLPTVNEQVRDIGKAAVPTFQRLEQAVSSVRPLVDSSTALVVDVQASLDDSYDDIKALIESTTVTATSIGQNSLPTANAITDLTVQVAGIATDAHKVTTRFTEPRPWPSKIWEAIKLAAAVGGRFAP